MDTRLAQTWLFMCAPFAPPARPWRTHRDKRRGDVCATLANSSGRFSGNESAAAGNKKTALGRWQWRHLQLAHLGVRCHSREIGNPVPRQRIPGGLRGGFPLSP